MAAITRSDVRRQWLLCPRRSRPASISSLRLLTWWRGDSDECGQAAVLLPYTSIPAGRQPGLVRSCLLLSRRRGNDTAHSTVKDICLEHSGHDDYPTRDQVKAKRSSKPSPRHFKRSRSQPHVISEMAYGTDDAFKLNSNSSTTGTELDAEVVAEQLAFGGWRESFRRRGQTATDPRAAVAMGKVFASVTAFLSAAQGAASTASPPVRFEEDDEVEDKKTVCVIACDGMRDGHCECSLTARLREPSIGQHGWSVCSAVFRSPA